MSSVVYDTSSTPKMVNIGDVMQTPWVQALLWCAYFGHEWYRISEKTIQCSWCRQYQTEGGPLTLEQRP